ncbi:hypothetical protein [Kineococcus sp. SYSU DK004]|uniref:hypothetical protein n=1 Tax=Kineococcus sp. SYSU DK004 TaxID=3383125 RepID=UPI003D7D1137
MLRDNVTNPFARAAAAGVLAFSVVGLTGCGDTAGPEEGVSVEDVQEGGDSTEEPGAEVYDDVYGSAFYDGLNEYYGEEVTVSADVNTVVDDTSFVIAGTDDTSVDPMLVIGADSTSELEPGLTVRVTGTVYETFDLTTVEEELGTDLDDELFGDYDAQPYIDATNVDETVASDT